MSPYKTPMALVDLDFVAKMADVLHEGLQRANRKANGWKSMPWSDDIELEYISALLRHLRAGDYVSVATNAMILDHHQTKGATSEE